MKAKESKNNKMYLPLVLFILFNSCKTFVEISSREPLQHTKEIKTTYDLPKVSQDKLDTIALDKNYIAILKDKKLSIINQESGINSINNHIIRLQDESGNCFSEGFIEISGKNSQIILKQQICSSKFIINETAILKVVPSIPEIFLDKLIYQKISKRNPNNIIKPEVYDQKDFGALPLKKINLDSLYVSIQNPSKKPQN